MTDQKEALGLSGKVVRGYELRQLLGSGGFGAVYQGFQTSVLREVALKVILPRYANAPDFIRRFESEAQLVARLEHPNIVPLYDFWREPDGAYLVMRYLRGGSVRQTLRNGAWRGPAIVRLLDQIAAALWTAHRAGIVHQDMKPDNILLDTDGNAYLADFGIAQDIAQPKEDSEDKLLVGSPPYISPEQITGDPPTPQTDIYSLGIVLYELLTGEQPFREQNPSRLLVRHLHDPLPSLVRPGLPSRLDEVIQKATAKAPPSRYPDVVSLADDFRAAIGTGLYNTPLGPGKSTSPHTQAGVRTPIIGEASPKDPNSTAPIGKLPQQGDTAGTVKLGDLPAAKPTGADTVGIGYEQTTAIRPPSDITMPLDSAPVQNPYKGLRAFQEADAVDFYGRDDLTKQLLARLTENVPYQRFLAVIGPSGSGKSSVVRAGVIPALRRGELPGAEKWFIADMIPGAHPFEELEEDLLRVAVTPPPNLRELLKADETALDRVVSEILPDAGEFLIFIDQFEEIFTAVADEDERANFLASLVNAVSNPNGRLRVVVSMRADFYDRPLQYAEFGALLRERTAVVLPLTREELKAAITLPAGRAGLRLESGLADAILEDVRDQPGVLPLLQFALSELYENRDGRLLTLAAYQASGGVLGAMTRRADQIYESFSPDKQRLTRQMFLRLVTPESGLESQRDTRRRIPRNELLSLLGADSAATNGVTIMNRVIDTFGQYRLLTFDRDPISRTPTVEVAHEALIRTWERLSQWLEGSREDLRTARRLTDAVREWSNAQREPSFLATGARLEQFDEWAARTDFSLSADERTYLQISRSEQAARQARDARIARRVQNFQRAVLGLGGLATLALIAFLWAANGAAEAQAKIDSAAQTLTPVQVTLQAGQDQIAEARITATSVALAVRQQEAQIESLRLAEEASRVLEAPSTAGGPELAALLAAAGLSTAYSPAAEAALINAADQLYTTGRLANVASDLNGALASPDGRYWFTYHDKTPATLWLAQSGEIVRQFPTEQIVYSAAFAGNNQLLLATGNGEIAVWDYEKGTLTAQYPLHSGAVLALAAGESLAVSGGEDGLVRLWEIKTGAIVSEQAVEGSVWALALALADTGDVSAVAAGTDAGLLYVWSKTGLEPLLQAEASPEFTEVFSVALQMPYVAAGGADGVIRIWDTSSGLQLQTLSGHTDLVNMVQFGQSSDEQPYLLSAGADGTARLWDYNLGLEVRRFAGHTDAVLSAQFAPQAGPHWPIITASSDGTARLWEANPGLGFARFTGVGGFVQAGPEPALVYTAGREGLFTLDFASGQRQQLAALSALAWFSRTSDGKLLAAKDTLLSYYDAEGRLIWQADHKADILWAAYHPAANLAATAGLSNEILLWDLATGQARGTLLGHQNWVTDVLFSADGQKLYSSSLDSRLLVWDLASQRIQRDLGAGKAIWAIAIAPDENQVALGLNDGRIALWNLQEAQTGKADSVLVGHGLQITALAFAPDGQTLLSASFDGTARFWQLSNGQELRRFGGHTGPVRGIAFSSDGLAIFTAGEDGLLRRWQVKLDSALQVVCAALYRPLSRAEQSQYGIGKPPCPA
jgi:WD40 repeat protein/serine/threonine protein kinase/energy-coupling factor transporter ATP-binding protein EcfA2